MRSRQGTGHDSGVTGWFVAVTSGGVRLAPKAPWWRQDTLVDFTSSGRTSCGSAGTARAGPAPASWKNEPSEKALQGSAVTTRREGLSFVSGTRFNATAKLRVAVCPKQMGCDQIRACTSPHLPSRGRRSSTLVLLLNAPRAGCAGAFSGHVQTCPQSP